MSNAIGYAKHYSRSHDAVIRVYHAAGNVTETQEHKGEARLGTVTAAQQRAGLSKRVRPNDALRQFGMRNGVRRLAWSPICHGSPKQWG